MPYWIETEDLVEQDGLDANMAITGVFADFDVRLYHARPKLPLKSGLGVDASSSEVR